MTPNGVVHSIRTGRPESPGLIQYTCQSGARLISVASVIWSPALMLCVRSGISFTEVYFSVCACAGIINMISDKIRKTYLYMRVLFFFLKNVVIVFIFLFVKNLLLVTGMKRIF